MGFVTPALLGGAAFIALPIVLHLIMRRDARKLVFPALRFVQRRQSLNQHRLRLRHWLLLALRCAIIALLAFALARPVLRGSGVAGKEGRPIATVLVFDNSLRMEYLHENQTRLDQAKDLADWLLGQLPPDSPVTVVDRSDSRRGSAANLDAAELRVERLATSGAVRPLSEALRDATDWLKEQIGHRGEIYVFTDLATEAWPNVAIADFKARLDELPDANAYLIDVSVEQPRNVGLAPLRLSKEQLAPGGLLAMDTELLPADAASVKPAATDAEAKTSATDAPGTAEDSPATTGSQEVVVELYVGARFAESEKRGQVVATPADGQPVPVEFSLSGLPLGTHQGYVRIVGRDALPCDDVRYFTLDVRPPSRLLLLAETTDSALFLSEALSPNSATGFVQSKFDCQSSTFDQLETVQLAEFNAICLIDPPPLSAETWQALADFAQAGGGVGVFLGRQARRDEFNQPAPQQLLPAQLRWVSREATYLRPVAVEHPALAELRDLADIVPWSEFPVFQYWELEAGAESAHVVAAFANGQPALVEQLVGSGRVLMMTTSVSDPAHGDPWNLLPTAPDPWPFLALANGIADYLVGGSDAQLNYLAGQSVVIRLSPEEQTTSYVLQMPDSSAVRQSLTPGRQDLSIASTESLGNYRVRAGGEQGGLDRGFSVNCPAEMCRLERTTAKQIAAALGEERVRVARSREEIEVRVGLGRVGRELFPILILAVALVLGVEHLLANRFHRTTP
ncbi:MAG: BatA domain-containing protein [Planctomycetes bacterium]|nr:BatA domain-containing protein [Planctomycetota bacterium]